MSTCHEDALSAATGAAASSGGAIRFRIAWAILLGLASAMSLGWSVRAQADQSAESRSLARAADQGPARPAVPAVELEVLKLLNQGRQDEAERLLDLQTGRFPQAIQLLKLLAAHKPKEAEQFVAQNVDALQQAQPSFFLFAACKRSRFEMQISQWLFYAVRSMNPTTPAGKCALRVMRLDSLRMKRGSTEAEVKKAFADFYELVEANPNDVVIRWMLAVQCRNWHRNAEGAVLYRRILEQWNPGPALLHQTYANLLDQLNRYEEALAERYKVVAVEPASWSYDGLANTLNHLKRYPEADEAHAMAVKLDPDRAQYWINWAVGLYENQKYDLAIEKCQRAIALDQTEQQAWKIWFKSLTKQNKYKEALDIAKRSFAISEAQRGK